MAGRIVLLRAAVWGQAVGVLAFASFLVFEDAPDYFERVSLWAILLPLAAIVAVQVPAASRFMARSVSSALLAWLVLVPSISTVAAAIAYVLQAYAIPDTFVTEGWRYTRSTSIAVLGIFLLALVVNIVLSITMLRPTSARS